MFFRRYSSRVAIIAFLFLVGFGCGSAPQQQESRFDPFTLFWPLPPEKPRIKYYDSLRQQSDVNADRKLNLSDSIFGSPEPEFSLRKPYGVTTDNQGRVYVSDVGGIAVFDKKNRNLNFIGNTGGTRLIRPLGMFFEKKSNLLYVADSALDKVIVFTPDGRAVTEIGQKGELKDPGGVVVDTERKRIYVTNTKRHCISVFDMDGRFIKNMGEREKDPELQFNFPTQIALGRNGELIVVDSGNFRIQIFDQEGKVIRQIGQIGMLVGQFARPKGVGVSPEGYIFVSDAATHGITVFDEKGTLLLTWGVRGWERGMFELPAGIHIDDKGLIYVVSQWTAKVDIFQFLSYPDDKLK